MAPNAEIAEKDHLWMDTRYGLIILSKPENREYFMASEIHNPNRLKSGGWSFVVS